MEMKGKDASGLRSNVGDFLLSFLVLLRTLRRGVDRAWS